MTTTLRRSSTMCCLALLAMGGGAAWASEAPPMAAAQATAAASGAPAAPGAKQSVAVAIYEFRSSVQEIPARGATDMFITALVHNGRFTVVERSQLNQSLLPEKQLNSQGLTTGTSASERLTGAQYVFEGTISETTASENQRAGSIGLGGISVGGGTNKDEIAVDVRVVEATTGRIVDAVTVRKALKSNSANVSAGNVLNRALYSFYSPPFVPAGPNVNLSQQRKDSLDVALRSVIEEAVTQLATKL